MKLNTNSNTYILVYSSVLVVIVAFLLATVYQSLKPAQDTNVALDKKKQILCSLNIRDIDNEEAEKKYKEIVTADEIMDESGKSGHSRRRGCWFQTWWIRLQGRSSGAVRMQRRW